MHGIPSRSEPGVIICKLEHSVDESDGPASRVSKMHCIPSRSEPSVIICRLEHSVDKSDGPASRVSKMHGIPSRPEPGVIICRLEQYTITTVAAAVMPVSSSTITGDVRAACTDVGLSVVGDACLIVGTVIAVAADGVLFTTTACDEVAACVAARLGVNAARLTGGECMSRLTITPVDVAAISSSRTTWASPAESKPGS
jgi:hypothetical protein